MPLFLFEMQSELFRRFVTWYLGFALRCFRGKKVWRGKEMKELWKALKLVEVADGVSCTLVFVYIWKLS